MKKQLPTDAIVNELEGSSVFFYKPRVKSERKPKSAETKRIDSQPSDVLRDGVAPTNQDAIPPRNHGAKPPRNHDTVIPRNHGSGANGQAVVLESLRQAVKQLGKEAATHRFTAAEKRQIAEIIYQYSRRGVRTSENEITRIAVNWLLLEHEAKGAESVLAQMLERLHG